MRPEFWARGYSREIDVYLCCMWCGAACVKEISYMPCEYEELVKPQGWLPTVEEEDLHQRRQASLKWLRDEHPDCAIQAGEHVAGCEPQRKPPMWKRRLFLLKMLWQARPHITRSIVGLCIRAFAAVGEFAVITYRRYHGRWLHWRNVRLVRRHQAFLLREKERIERERARYREQAARARAEGLAPRSQNRTKQSRNRKRYS